MKEEIILIILYAVLAAGYAAMSIRVAVRKKKIAPYVPKERTPRFKCEDFANSDRFPLYKNEFYGLAEMLEFYERKEAKSKLDAMRLEIFIWALMSGFCLVNLGIHVVSLFT